jgi:hypothetical protein
MEYKSDRLVWLENHGRPRDGLSNFEPHLISAQLSGVRDAIVGDLNFDGYMDPHRHGELH